MEEPNQDLKELETAITAAMEFPVHNLSQEELIERASRIQRIKTRLHALSAQASSQILESDSVGTVRRTITGLATATGHDPKQPRQELKIARWLIDFPVFRSAFANGNLSLAHLQLLKGLDTITTRLRLVESQESLLQAARTITFTEFKSVIAYWLNAADPDGKEPLHAEARSGCSYRQNSDGSINGKFYLDAVSAGAFKTAFDTRRQALFRSDAEQGITRSPWQRGASALLSLVGAGHEAGGPDMAPLISIVMGAEVAENALARLIDPSVPAVDPDRANINRRCELIDGTPIHPTQAIRAAVWARFMRIVMETKSRNTDVSLKSRGFPAWMRHILLIRSRGKCSELGCDSPAPWLQADHIVAYSRGGPTRLSNGQMLCGPHNQAKQAS